MKANELRIGNWLSGMFNTNDGFLQQPLEISPDVIYEIYDGVGDYNPIPLTEEWLLRFGFLKADEWHFWINLQTHYFELMYSNLHWYPIIAQLPEMSIEEEQRVGLNAIYHVHQLQNLYFGLTGQELTIKEAAR